MGNTDQRLQMSKDTSKQTDHSQRSMQKSRPTSDNIDSVKSKFTKVEDEIVEDDRFNVEFDTQKSTHHNEKHSPSDRVESVIRNRKKQGFLPKELLLFLDLDSDFIESFM